MTNLDLIDTQDLLDELKRRHDHMVWAGIKVIRGDGSLEAAHGEFQLDYDWKGCFVTCQGLGATVANRAGEHIKCARDRRGGGHDEGWEDVA